MLREAKSGEVKGTGKPRVSVLFVCAQQRGLCVDMWTWIRTCLTGSETCTDPSQANGYLALGARWELALGLGPGDFAGPGKSHLIPTQFLPNTLGHSSSPLPHPPMSWNFLERVCPTAPS